LSDDEVYTHLLRYWVMEYGTRVDWPPFTFVEKATVYKYFTTPPWFDPQYVKTMTREQLIDVLDRFPGFMLHKLAVWKHVEEMGGLHIVGTERHESRRIDNQLRGRAGRQGDRGSSRFFICFDDELMKNFANRAVLGALSRLGMKEGDAIEH